MYLIKEAVKGNDKRLLKLIHSKVDVNYRDDSNTTALMAASLMGHDKYVKILLEASADTNYRNFRNETALTFASEKGNTNCMSQLLKAKAQVDIITNVPNNTTNYCIRKRPY